MKIKIRTLLAGALVLGLAGCGTARTYITDSRPPARQIMIDGRSDDWIGSLNIVADAELEEGFLNDQEFLYVSFVTEDESLRRQIARGGLTVWFDPKGGNEKVLGIKYPVGIPRVERPATKKEEAGGPPPNEPAGGVESSLELYRAGDATPQKLELDSAKGLELAASREGKLFIYELKIPLQPSSDHPIAVGALPGKTVGIGFEVPKSDSGRQGSRPQGETGGRGGGGRGGGGFSGGMGGGGGSYGGAHGRLGGQGGGPGTQSAAANGLKIWTYVKLSSRKGLSPATPQN
ncbi:MAG: hypothetical protein ABSG19_01565 [Candidatus Aminicenantales bacterium]